MPEKDILFKTKVKHKGIFDFAELYRILHEWLIDQGYDLNEKKYKEVVGARGTRELEIEWEALRKVSDYFRYLLEVKWHPIEMTDVEVEIEGVKKKMNKGQFEIEVKSTLIKDYEDRWASKPIIKFLRGLYDRYIIKDKIEQYETRLIGEMDEFVGQAKSFLALTGKS